MKKQQNRSEGIFSLIAAIIVLFSAMWNPMTSIIISIATLIGFGIYKLMSK